MNRRTAVIAAVAGVATVAITASITGGRSSSLPLPHPVVVKPAVTKARSGSGKSTTTTTSPTGLQGGVTTTTLAQLTACAVSVSNPSPTQGNTAETVTVRAVPEAYVTLVARYPSTLIKHTGTADATGTTAFAIAIKHAPVGTTITFSATASLQSTHVNCSSASFTPVL